MKKQNSIFAAAQRLGVSLMLPIAVLPVAALLLRFGVLFNLPFMTAAGDAFFGNLALLFGIGVAIGLSKDRSGAAGLSGAVGHLVIVACSEAINADIKLGVFSGIIGGIIGAVMYNKYCDIKLPQWLGFFAGRRFVPIVTALVSLITAVIIGYVWPYVGKGLDSIGIWVTGSGALGLFVYGTLNRLLIPLGLHHILNSLVWFVFGNYTGPDGVVTGDLNRFFAGDPTAGSFMTGFFPIMMFALPAASFAMYLLAKKTNRKVAAGILFSVAFTGFLTGITEPIEFLFMFLAPALYVAHALLTGAALAISHVLGMKLGFGFSAGLIDYIVNFNIATKPLLLIPIGIVFGLIYFILFYVYIKSFDIKTPGREDIKENTSTLSSRAISADVVQNFLVALGGLDNLTHIGSCISRLRLEVNDSTKIDENALKLLGSQGIVRPSEKTVQVVLGQDAEQIANELIVLKTNK